MSEPMDGAETLAKTGELGQLVHTPPAGPNTPDEWQMYDHGWEEIGGFLGMSGRSLFGTNAVGLALAVQCADVKARDIAKAEGSTPPPATAPPLRSRIRSPMRSPTRSNADGSRNRNRSAMRTLWPAAASLCAITAPTYPAPPKRRMFIVPHTFTLGMTSLHITKDTSCSPRNNAPDMADRHISSQCCIKVASSGLTAAT